MATQNDITNSEMKDLKIVFMGTPEFAVTILNGIIEGGANVIGVITAPDRPAGRGRKINESAVKQYAVSKSIPILQPTNLKNTEFINTLKKIGADLFVVVAFRMLPEVVWGMPNKGTINLHASLLPQYRGAAPINWAIINGEKETGVTTFFIEKEIDTGKIIQTSTVNISENQTAGELHDALALEGVKVMTQTIENIALGNLKLIDQNSYSKETLKSAPKIFKNDCRINWKSDHISAHNFIRGLAPYPGAWCKVIFKEKELSCKIFNSQILNIEIEDQFAIKNTEDSFLFPCSDKYISIKEIQLEGKRRISYKEFIAGNSINDLKLLH